MPGLFQRKFNEKDSLFERGYSVVKDHTGYGRRKKGTVAGNSTDRRSSLSEMMVWSDKQDASGIVKELFRQLEDLDKEEALCYFASFLPIPERERVKDQV